MTWKHCFRSASVAVVLAVGIAACGTDASDTSTSSRSSTTPAAVTVLPADITSQIDALGEASLVDGVTGAIVSVSDPARGTYLKAYGTSDSAGTPMSTEMHYRIASVSKTLTADAILKLAGDDRLSLTDPLSRYVPDIPNGDQISIRDLLAMRAGVFDFTADPGFLARYNADPSLPGWTPDDVLTILRANADKATAPQTATVYSNSNYILLGFVLEKVTGQPVHEHISGLIREMGLDQTSFPTTDQLPEPFSRGFISDGSATGPYPDGTISNPLVPWTAGAVISTVPDMTRYAAILANGEGLTPDMAAQRQDWTPLSNSGVRLQYGLGITQLGDWVGHDGSIFGYSDLVFYLPEQKATVVVMANAANGESVPAQALWGEVVKLMYPDSLPEWP